MTKVCFNLDENVAASLTYILGWISGLFFYLMEDKNKFVRFHAMQSIITFLGLTIIYLILEAFLILPLISIIIIILNSILTILSIILWIFLIINAYKGKKIMLPIIGNIAEKYS